MKFSLSVASLALITLTLLSSHPAQAQTQTYTYVDLGQVWVSGINNAGQIIASINPTRTVNGPQSVLITPLDTNADGKPDTWYRDLNNDGVNDLMTLLPVPPGHTGSIPHAINSSGEIAGDTRGTTGNHKVGQQAFFTAAGASLSENVDSGHSYAGGINDFGVLAGWVYTFTNTGKFTVTTWKKTVNRKGILTWTATSLSAPSGYTSTSAWGPQCINNDGAIAARTVSPTIVPLVWLPSALYGYAQGGWKVLPGLNGAGGDTGAINNRGQLAGYSNGHGVLWTLAGGSVSLQDLHPTQPELASFTVSNAYGLNHAPNGVLSVVGMIDNGVSATRPFLWRSDTQQTVVLNDFITAGLPAGLVPWEAKAINDAGVIIGSGVPNGDPNLLIQQRGFVLIPNP